MRRASVVTLAIVLGSLSSCGDDDGAATPDGECERDADCAEGVLPYCEANTCVSCRRDEHCLLGSTCAGGACVDAPGMDAGVDAGPPDAGPPDAGPPDAERSDAGPPDSGPPDAGPVCVAMPSGIVSWIPFDRNGSDVVGSGFALCSGGILGRPGRFDGAFLFDGIDAQCDVIHRSFLDFGAGDFTIDLWFNLATLATDQVFFQKVSGTTTADPTYFVELNTPSSLRFAVIESTTNRNDLIVPVTLVVDTWYHFTAVRMGNTSVIYLDGVMVGMQTAGTAVDTGTGGQARMARTGHDGSGIFRFLDGFIDEFILFDRAISQAEAQALGMGLCRLP